MPDTQRFGDTRLNCAALARALGVATSPVSELPSDLQLPEAASCWVGPKAPALIRLLPSRPEPESTPPPLVWINSADIGGTACHQRVPAPVISTPLQSSEALARIQSLIDARLDLTRPGTLVQVHGCGVLLQGASGVGKSETALMLIERGHSLVTDDAVRIRAHSGGALIGSGPGPLHGQLALHGLGLLKIDRLFGETAVTSSAAIRLIVALTAQAAAADPLHGAWTVKGWLGRTLPLLTLSSQRPRALLIETAVRQMQTRSAGADWGLESAGEQVPELV
ncbi:MAG: hypothetical protein L0H73_07005 [Nitrococcus sp.]|nr:hypothetical protein [Nitrococcus sp.]